MLTPTVSHIPSDADFENYYYFRIVALGTGAVTATINGEPFELTLSPENQIFVLDLVVTSASDATSGTIMLLGTCQPAPCTAKARGSYFLGQNNPYDDGTGNNLPNYMNND